MNNPLYKFARKVAKKAIGIGELFKKQPDSFFGDISGLVHVGANTGQERKIYHQNGLNVIWIEPIPDIFDQLKENIKDYNDQQAFKALVTDVDDKKYEFNIANNNGASSSIYDFKDHKDIWPHVSYQKSISINSITLTSLFEKESIDTTKYQALIMDTQGSELLVLKGSLPILNNFEYVKTEVADFESYDGGCKLEEMSDFMVGHGFKEYHRKKYYQKKKGSNYYDIVYKRLP